MAYLDSDTVNKAPRMTGTTPPLDVAALPDNPYDLFTAWFTLAVEHEVADARAATLATVDEQGLPDARIVDLMHVDGNGWAFGTGAGSVKSAQLSANPKAALNFFWQPQIRAVRLRGAATLAHDADGFHIWQIQPEHVEFWQAGEGYNSTRITYDRDGDAWALTVTE